MDILLVILVIFTMLLIFVYFIKDTALLYFALWKHIVIGSTHSMNIVVGFLAYDKTLE